MIKTLIIFGTRPEAIKMAPLVKELAKYPEVFDTKVCVTSQHRQMLDQVLRVFDLKPDFDLNIMRKDQDLYSLTAGILTEIKDVFEVTKPDLVLVHGDTTTSYASSLAAFYRKINVGHVEAGLRTNNIYSPWPEEFNRQSITRVATYHFAPTKSSKNNLLKENVAADNIVVTGNTVIDALMMMVGKINQNKVLEEEIRFRIKKLGYEVNTRPFLLVTGHRRENFGQGLFNICAALKQIGQARPEVDIVYPAHLNPNVQLPVHQCLAGIGNIYILEPVEYDLFVYLMNKSHFILTDSGGIQEEAPSLGKPVLVMRDLSERPEALAAGTARLVGASTERITSEVNRLLDNKKVYHRMATAHNPYGDGLASKRIVDFLRSRIRDLTSGH